MQCSTHTHNRFTALFPSEPVPEEDFFFWTLWYKKR